MKDKHNRKNRQLKRILFEQDIEVMGGKNCRSVDLGVGGIYLATDAEIPMGKPLLLRFKLVDSDSTPITAQGRVVFSESGKGVGIEFKNLPWDTLQRINTYLEDKPNKN